MTDSDIERVEELQRLLKKYGQVDIQTLMQRLECAESQVSALLACDCGSVANYIQGNDLPRLGIYCRHCDGVVATTTETA